MSFRSGGESAAAIAGHSHGRRAHRGMQAEGDHASAGARAAGGSSQRRWRSDDLRSMSARTGASLSCALFVERKLRGGRDNGAVSDVEFAKAAVRGGIQVGRRSDDG